jgi:hypothetical protein
MNRKEIRKHLRCIVQQGNESVYRLSLRRFLKQWRRKTDAEVARLVVQLKATIVENRVIATEVLGVAAVNFFERL